MLNNDQRSGLAKEARRTYNFAPMSLDVNGARADWLAVVDYLWQEFSRTTTPRPRHDDDLRDLGDHPPTNPDQGRADECATLRGTVSGLRAELAATLRRMEQAQTDLRAALSQRDEARESLDDYKARNVAGERALEQVTFERDNLERTRDTLAPMVNSLRQQIAGQERYLGNIAADLDREQDAHRQTMRDLETAREAAEQYRRDATDSALRLGRIRKALDD